jgi:hypothetical protein
VGGWEADDLVVWVCEVQVWVFERGCRVQGRRCEGRAGKCGCQVSRGAAEMRRQGVMQAASAARSAREFKQEQEQPGALAGALSVLEIINTRSMRQQQQHEQQAGGLPPTAASGAGGLVQQGWLRTPPAPASHSPASPACPLPPPPHTQPPAAGQGHEGGQVCDEAHLQPRDWAAGPP